MEQFDFNDWWKEFQSSHSGDKDGGTTAVLHLKEVVSEFPYDKRILIVDEFIKINKIGIASELIERDSTENQKSLIRDKFSEWLSSKSDNSIGGIYIMAILRTFVDSDLELLKVYFAEQRGVGFRIPIELYSIDKSLFLEAFETLLTRWSNESVYKYDGLLYLTKHLAVLEYLIDNLSPVQSKRMQEFCRVKSNHSYVNDDKWREELLKLANKKTHLTSSL